ncbi:P60-like protein [Gloeophyllum trabeum ATCC 11539]|uniref:Ribosome biogenesis protein NOP53 n=1 Tax=Gloeophyllum trabeum (strain ATCC 11539 / FP-39264 / Madison 617) TaxID=670483 RepID=S7PSG4_GLOTA|nr:P60-like protein [Gloeophyllum trabeum ATCC 11539]EPQ50756.1 P60-like protein [Gloeophyllum trabeum ATCC 11539]
MATAATTMKVSSTARKEVKAKKTKSSVGAPAQLKQGSRKGKKAWRKNVDIEDVEEGMEGMRAEERVTGSALQKKKDEDLFQVDTHGDDKVRKSLPKYSKSALTSTKILSQRSAVPAVFSRSTTSSSSSKRKLTHEEKERLLRIAKRRRKGPLNSYVDESEVGKGSATMEVSEAAKSGGYDIWSSNTSEDVPVDAPKKQPAKPPPHPLRSQIQLPAVEQPHVGTSYNPPVDAHTELVLSAAQIEEKRIREAEKLKEWQEKADAARKVAREEEAEGVPPGMTVGEGEEDPEAGVDEVEGRVAPKMPRRKTKQDRKRAERLRKEKQALAERAARKRLLTSVTSVKALRSMVNRSLSLSEKTRAERQRADEEKLRKGLAGQRIGKHKVPEGEVDVQLGEDLSESLRGLKPEGNLFRDRFLSLQKRALIEPRQPVIPKRRRTKDKEYEKHAWKRFDREQF